MAIRISNLHLGLDESEGELPGRIAKVLGVLPGELISWRILRKSLDARDKDSLHYVYTTEVRAAGDESRLVALAQRGSTPVRIERHEEPSFQMPAPGTQPLKSRPVVVGSGPAGLAAAYFLAEQGYRPLVLERGRAVRDRIHDVQAFDRGGPHDPESNYLFGE